MDLSEALDIVVGRTKHERYRDLCDQSHAAYNPAWPDAVIAMASGSAWPPKPTMEDAILQWYADALAMFQHQYHGGPRPCCGGSTSGETRSS